MFENRYPKWKEVAGMLPEFDITGRTVLITGAGRGIGKSVALVMAEAGADVAVTGLTEVNAANVAHDIRNLGRRGLVHGDGVRGRVLGDDAGDGQ